MCCQGNVFKKRHDCRYNSTQPDTGPGGILWKDTGYQFYNYNGHPAIAPAKTGERVNNEESMSLYPVFHGAFMAWVNRTGYRS